MTRSIGCKKGAPSTPTSTTARSALTSPPTGSREWHDWPSPMNEMAKLILVVWALLLSAELAAQPFKCTDAAGKITYSGTQCSELGLKDAGEVKDRLNVNPAQRRPAATPSSAPAAKAPNTEVPA